MADQRTLDIVAWNEYRQGGGTLGLSAWLAAGKPPATPTPSNPFTSNKPIPPSGNPLAPGLPHPTPSVIEDTVDADIAAAEKAAAADAQKRALEGGGEEFSNPTKLPTTPPPVGYEWDWDGFRWQPKKAKEKETVDTELSNPKKMPATPAPTGFHWEWDGSQWGPIKDKAKTEGIKYPKPAGWQDYTDNDGNIHRWDENANGEYIAGYDPAKDQSNPANKTKGIPQPQDEVPTDKYGRKATWDENDGAWRYPPDWGTDPNADDEAKKRYEDDLRRQAEKDAEDKARWEAEQKRLAEDAAFRQKQAQQSSDQFWKQFDYQQQQDAARLQAEKEARLANLRANPASWLEYSQLANQTPVIQPWQKPLMPQQYGNLNVGQPIPGWGGLQGSSNLPELTTPSTQYFARIGPTAQQQWGGYQQMQSGAPMDESLFRLKSQSAPGGRNQGLSWLR